MEDDDEKPEVLMAYREGKARGLPDGWTCSIDVRKKTQYLPGYTARLRYILTILFRNAIDASGERPMVDVATAYLRHFRFLLNWGYYLLILWCQRVQTNGKLSRNPRKKLSVARLESIMP